jgi:hypothetical protein
MSEIQAGAAAMDMSAGDPGVAGSGPVTGGSSGGTWSHSETQKFDPRRKSPVVAAVLSVAPGVGQLYIGYYVRGFVIAFGFLLTMLISGSMRDPLAAFFGLSAGFLWVFNIIDAGRMAALYNHAAAGAESVQLPEDFKLPKMGGSIAGGVALLLFGGIALSNTAFGYSLDWLEEWWPVFPLALGGYLFARGVVDFMAGREAAGSSIGSSDERGDGE